MYRPSAVALLAATVALAAPVPKVKEVELYFPTIEGSKRVMEMKVGDTARETTETVTKVEVKDGKHVVTVERDAGGGAGRVVPTQVYEVSGKGVFRLTSGGVETKDPQPLLKLGVKAGDTWTSELQLTPPGGGGAARVIKTTYTMGKEEEVDVPAGKYKAIRVEVETEQGGSTTKGTTWYAVGVGMIKSERDLGESKMTQELKTFTPGKDAKR